MKYRNLFGSKVRGTRAGKKQQKRTVKKLRRRGPKMAGKVYKKAGLVTLTYHPPMKQLSPIPDRMFTTIYTTGQYTGNNGGLTTNYWDVFANSLNFPFAVATRKVTDAGNFITPVTASSAVATLKPIGSTLLSTMYQSYTVLSHSLELQLDLVGGYTTGTNAFVNPQFFGVVIYPYVLVADAQIDFHAATLHPRAVTRYFKCIGSVNKMKISLSEAEIQGWDELAFINDVSGTHDTNFGSAVASPTKYRVIWQSMNGVPIGPNDSVTMTLKQKVMLNQPVKILI